MLSRSEIVFARRLNGRARHRPKGTEHATITLMRAQQCRAPRTVIEVLTGIGWHDLFRLMPAMRASDGGVDDGHLLYLLTPFDYFVQIMTPPHRSTSSKSTKVPASGRLDAGGTRFHLPLMHFVRTSPLPFLRRYLVAMLIFAIALAPALMHVNPGIAASTNHHAMPVNGHHSQSQAEHHPAVAHHPASPDKDTKTTSTAGGACFYCVICVGATSVGPIAATPEYCNIALQPARQRVLTTSNPEPGIRPPQI